MKVILLEDVKGSGVKGDIIDAKDGYARNYLLPRGMAVEATKANINQLKNKKKAEERAEEEAAERAKEMADKLVEVSLLIKAKSGESGKLFGSVTNQEIAEELEKQHGLTIDRKRIVLDEPIKQLGEMELEVKLHPGVSGRLKVKVEEA